MFFLEISVSFGNSYGTDYLPHSIYLISYTVTHLCAQFATLVLTLLPTIFSVTLLLNIGTSHKYALGLHFQHLNEWPNSIGCMKEPISTNPLLLYFR